MPISVKGLSDTRWEARIEALKPLRYHFFELREALDALKAQALENKDGMTASESSSLSVLVSKWPFIINVVIWYDILYQVNKISKLLQSPSISLEVLDIEVKATEHFLLNYRDNGYNSACTDAREIAEKMDVPRMFPEIRIRRKKRMFDYEPRDEIRSLTAEFKSDFFDH